MEDNAHYLWRWSVFPWRRTPMLKTGCCFNLKSSSISQAAWKKSPILTFSNKKRGKAALALNASVFVYFSPSGQWKWENKRYASSEGKVRLKPEPTSSSYPLYVVPIHTMTHKKKAFQTKTWQMCCWDILKAFKEDQTQFTISLAFNGFL